MSDQNSFFMEDKAGVFTSTPEMQPYLRYMKAAMLGGDIGRLSQEIAEMPLEKRYVWRVACALRWATSK